METGKKVIMEQGYGDEYKRITVEENENRADAPGWNSMKDGVGNIILGFTNGFFKALLPAFLIFLFLFILLICKVLSVLK